MAQERLSDRMSAPWVRPLWTMPNNEVVPLRAHHVLAERLERVVDVALNLAVRGEGIGRRRHEEGLALDSVAVGDIGREPVDEETNGRGVVGPPAARGEPWSGLYPCPLQDARLDVDDVSRALELHLDVRWEVVAHVAEHRVEIVHRRASVLKIKRRDSGAPKEACPLNSHACYLAHDHRYTSRDTQ